MFEINISYIMPVLLGLAQEKVDKLKRYLDKTLSADVGCKIE